MGIGMLLLVGNFGNLALGTEPAGTGYVATHVNYDVPGCSNIQEKPTGFFYTKEIEGRWWLIDPNGQGFYIVGTDHCNYNVHWCEKLGYAPYARNVAAKYGSEEKWAAATAERLAEWGFNTLAANHSPSLRHRRFPHIEFLSLGTSFARLDDLCPQTTWTGFPNVFSTAWPAHCDELARKSCAPSKDDPWLIGYFLDNELEWFGKNHKPWGLFDEAWKKPAGHAAKQAWIVFLKSELRDVQAFQQNWGVTVESLDALAQHVEPQPPRNERAQEIARRWVRQVADEYFRTCAEAVRRHDPNHLIFGCRFAGDAPEVWDIAGKYCDIVSFNMYPRIDGDYGVPEKVIETIQAWHRKANKPMIITEWSFPALDTPLPSTHGAGMRVDTQAQRARCFEHFQSLMFRFSFMVGTNYFMYVDEPALGISSTFPENTNYGLVNEQDEPYPELTAAARTINRKVYRLHRRGKVGTAAKPGQVAAWLTEVPSKIDANAPEPLTLTSGELTLRGPVDGHAWELRYRNVPLARFDALMHEQSPTSIWQASQSAHVTEVRSNSKVTAVTMELDYAPVAAGEPAAHAYCSGWRFWIPHREGFFASQCLWVENRSRDSWKLAEVFHYLTPTIGGNNTDDEPMAGEVPNYYRRGSAWVDKGLGLGLGCWYSDEAAFACYFWKDANGWFHSDLRHSVNKTLKPGEQLTVNGPLAFFFPIQGISREDFAKAVGDIGSVVMK
ncbi:MAG: hypothetical protein HY706_19350 [Candidatus Hydrogenedentes bacterium]|nr:hypothetical protein [Candidatus Hydrogenedentota bacterium]